MKKLHSIASGKGLLRLSAMASAIIGASAACAQAPADEAKAAGPAEGAGQLQEVVITAQKRAQSAQKTPIVMSVISGDEMAAKGQNSIDAVLAGTPGVEVQNLANGAQIFIRGVGSSIDPSFADPAVALMLDGAYQGRTESSAAGTFDIARMEVLSGPQGTLYGRNATGGVVNVLTANPDLAGKEGYVRAQVGDYGLRRGEAMYNLPINARLGLRFSGFREMRNGYIDDGSMDADSWGARVKLLYQPVDWLKIVAKAETYRSGGHGTNTVPTPGSAGNLTFPPTMLATNFDASITNGPPFTGGAPIWRYPNGWPTASSSPWSNDAVHAPGRIERKSNSYSVQVDADLGFAQLTVLPAYTTGVNTLVSNFLFGTLAGDYDVVTVPNQYRSLEARLSSPASSPTKWLVGAYHMNAGGGFGDEQTSGAFHFTQQYLPSKTQAVFGQMTYPLTNRLRATAGLRFSKDSQGQQYMIENLSTGLDIRAEDLTTNRSSQYKVGGEYDLTPSSMAYAHIATGFKQGGLSPTIPAISYQPENLITYEAGVKNRFLNNRLQLNLSAFLYKYKHYQVTYLQVLELGTSGELLNFPTIVNASTPGHNKGAELGLDWRVTPNDRFKAALTFLHAKYGKVTLPNNPFVNQGDYSLEGHDMQNSPKWTTNLGYDHTFDVGEGQLIAGINSKLSKSYYVSAEQYLPGAYQAGFSRTDLSLRYIAPDEHWSLGLTLKNLEDKAQTTFVFPAYRRFVTAPRTAALQLEYRF